MSAREPPSEHNLRPRPAESARPGTRQAQNGALPSASTRRSAKHAGVALNAHGLASSSNMAVLPGPRSPPATSRHGKSSRRIGTAAAHHASSALGPRGGGIGKRRPSSPAAKRKVKLTESLMVEATNYQVWPRFRFDSCCRGSAISLSPLSYDWPAGLLQRLPFFLAWLVSGSPCMSFRFSKCSRSRMTRT